MKSIQTLAFGVLIGLGFSAMILLIARQPVGESITLQPPPTASPIEFFIDGAVHNPGLYQLPPGSRVGDAINSAGGYTDNASGQIINPARRILDGQMIHIPSTKDLEAERVTRVGSELVLGESININSATSEQLEQLPGVGPAKAAAIIEYRLINGPFQSLEDMLNVPGIGEGIIEDIREWVVLQ